MARPPKLKTSIPGFGCIFRPTYRDRHGEKRQSSVWWMEYKTHDGKARASTGHTDQAAAYSELAKLHGRYHSGELIATSAEHATIGECLNLLIADYRREKRASLVDVEKRVEKWLRPEFGSMRVVELRKRDIQRFTETLTRELKPASVNKCLANLRRALQLGADEDPPLVNRVPRWFGKIEEDNARTGILSPGQYRALRDCLPAHARLVLVIGYHLGMRRGEILGLKWEQVDFAAGVIRLARKQTKAKTARTAPIYGEMRAYLDMARETARGPFVVEFEGRRISSIRTAWERACGACGVEDARLHDLRRTAATNMDAAGISRERIKDCVGWKTDAMFARYRIGSDKSAQQTGEEMEKWMERNSETIEKARTM